MIRGGPGLNRLYYPVLRFISLEAFVLENMVMIFLPRGRGKTKIPVSPCPLFRAERENFGSFLPVAGGKCWNFSARRRRKILGVLCPLQVENFGTFLPDADGKFVGLFCPTQGYFYGKKILCPPPLPPFRAKRVSEILLYIYILKI